MKHAETITQLLERIGRLVANAEHADGFKPVQWEALRYLEQANVFSRNPGAMADYLGVTKGSVSQTVSTLEQRGLIKKSTDKHDKRVTRLALTAAGRKRLQQHPLQAMIDSAEQLTLTRQQQLTSGLKTLLSHHLDRQNRSQFGQCKACRHLRQNETGYHCSLLNEPLQAPSVELICAEYEPLAAKGRT